MPLKKSRRHTPPELHLLKTDTRWFSPTKTWTIRLNDRDFCVDDMIVSREIQDGQFTGHVLLWRIRRVIADVPGVKKGYVYLMLEER